MTKLPAAIDVAAISDTGRVREHNEDAVWLGDRFFRSGLQTSRFEGDEVERLVLAVADGVGGAAAGEVASRFVAERMAARLAAADAPETFEELEEFVQAVAAEVNASLEAEASTDPERAGMATTYTGLFLTSAACVWMNAGDSRVYALRDGVLRQLNVDHTLRQELNDPSIPGNIITNCYGHQDGFRMDVGSVDLEDADLYIVCSDGLSDYADMERATEILARAAVDGDPERLADAAEQLLDLALSGGGGDNVSFLIARPTYA
ncbi:MAG: PP2C family protein-serine/threonine phosphatase [bacterium]